MRKTINDQRCIICGTPNIFIHEAFFGNQHRKLSIKWGMCVNICYEHHQGDSGVHKNRELDLHVKQIAQRAFEAEHGHEKFMETFGRNYL